MKQGPIEYHFFPSDTKSLIKQIGKETLLQCLKQMLLIRNFEIRAESSLSLKSKVGRVLPLLYGARADPNEKLLSVSWVKNNGGSLLTDAMHSLFF